MSLSSDAPLWCGLSISGLPISGLPISGLPISGSSGICGKGALHVSCALWRMKTDSCLYTPRRRRKAEAAEIWGLSQTSMIFGHPPMAMASDRAGPS